MLCCNLPDLLEQNLSTAASAEAKVHDEVASLSSSSTQVEVHRAISLVHQMDKDANNAFQSAAGHHAALLAHYNTSSGPTPDILSKLENDLFEVLRQVWSTRANASLTHDHILKVAPHPKLYIILGAGIAGWSLASMLVESGHHVHLYEKRHAHANRGMSVIDWNFAEHADDSFGGKLKKLAPGFHGMKLPLLDSDRTVLKDDPFGEVPAALPLGQLLAGQTERQLWQTPITAVQDHMRLHAESTAAKNKVTMYLVIREIFDIEQDLLKKYGTTRVEAVIIANGAKSSFRNAIPQ